MFECIHHGTHHLWTHLSQSGNWLLASCDERLAAVCRRESQNGVQHHGTWDEGCPEVGKQEYPQTHTSSNVRFLWARYKKSSFGNMWALNFVTLYDGMTLKRPLINIYSQQGKAEKSKETSTRLGVRTESLWYLSLLSNMKVLLFLQKKIAI